MDEISKSCVQISNQLILRFHLPIPRLQWIMEIDSTLFHYLLNIICDTWPVGFKPHPQTIEEEKHNLNLIIRVLSNEVLDIPLPHITAEAIAVDRDPAVIYCLLEIFDRYSNLCPPKVGFQTAGDLEVPVRKSEPFEYFIPMTEEQTSSRHPKWRQQLKLSLPERGQSSNEIIQPVSLPIRLTDTRQLSQYTERYHRKDKENWKTSILTETQPLQRKPSLTHSCPYPKANDFTNYDKYFVPSQEWSPTMKSTDRQKCARYSSDEVHDSSLIEQSLSPSESNGPIIREHVVQFQTPLKARKLHVCPRHQVGSQSTRIQQRGKKVTCKEKKLQTSGERNWKKGVELCAKTYEFKIPQPAVRFHETLHPQHQTKQDELAQYAKHLLGLRQSKGTFVKQLPSVIHKHAATCDDLDKQVSAQQRKRAQIQRKVSYQQMWSNHWSKIRKSNCCED